MKPWRRAQEQNERKRKSAGGIPGEIKKLVGSRVPAALTELAATALLYETTYTQKRSFPTYRCATRVPRENRRFQPYRLLTGL